MSFEKGACMRLGILGLLAMSLLICAGCSDTTGTVQGNGGSAAGHGHVEIGVPF
jgi:hypothetical protein